MSQGIQVFSDSSRGVYIPQHFAESVNRAYIVNPDRWEVVLDYLKDTDTTDEIYWDVWGDVLDNLVLQDKDGDVWRLHQDGDLFLVCYTLLTVEEREYLFDC